MHILIHGDSWGCGTWKGSKTAYRGLELFLKMYGYTVTNLSVPGYCNDRVFKDLSKLNLKDYNYIFIFYTNPFRDLPAAKWCYDFFNVPNQTLNYDDYLGIYKKLTRDFLENLDDLQHKMYLIGGHNKVYNPYTLLKNVEILIPSLREMFYPNFKEETIVFSQTIFKDYLEKFNLDALNQFSHSKNYMTELANIQREYFFPDGYHLNINGHKVLSEYIHNFIQNK